MAHYNAAVSGSRAIDKFPSTQTREVPMAVLVLGLSRTSTFSMTEALKLLGYDAYHMKEVFANFQSHHIQYWNDALKRKYHDQPGKYGKAEFDKILGKYSAVTDAPCAVFSDELLDAYPDAKVVLLTRDPDKWVASIEASYYRILGWRKWRMIAAIDHAMIGPYTEILELILLFWTKGDITNRTKLREGYLGHNEHIRLAVGSRLLEFHPADGWAPLCKFLDMPIPQSPYPRVNEGTYTADRHWLAIWIRLAVVLGKASFKISPILAVLGAIAWWYQYSIT